MQSRPEQPCRQHTTGGVSKAFNAKPVLAEERLTWLCRYEVQGEYVIPPDTHIPDSAASMAPMELMGSRSGTPSKAPKSAFEQATGRWRLQVSITPCFVIRMCLSEACQVLTSNLGLTKVLCLLLTIA